MSEQTDQPLALSGAPHVPFAEMQKMAEAIAASKMFFGIKDPAQALTMMLLCQAEGLHPALAIRRYHPTPKGPAMRSDAMLGEFLARKGGVVWHIRTNSMVAATFFAPGIKVDQKAIDRGNLRIDALTSGDEKALRALAQQGEETVVRTLAEAIESGIATTYGDNNEIIRKDNWKPGKERAMLTARSITEGIRVIMPALIAGIPCSEELDDYSNPEPLTVSVEQAAQVKEERQQQAAANVNAAADNRAADAGEIVQVTPDNWQEVEIHIGTTGGPYLGKTVGQVFGPDQKLTRCIKLMDYLQEEYIPKQEKMRAALGNKHNQQDARLLDALTFAKASIEERKQSAANVPKTVETEVVPSTEALPPTKAASAPALTEAKEPEKAKTQDWRDVEIPFACKMQGKKLGDLPPIGDYTPIDIYRAIEGQLIENAEIFASVDKKIANHFKASYLLGAAEMGIEPELDKAALLGKVREMVGDLMIAEATFCERMEDWGVLPRTKTDKKHLANCDEDQLRNIIRKWPQIDASLTSEFNLPLPSERKKKGSK
jgi:hypothetical protein